MWFLDPNHNKEGYKKNLLASLIKEDWIYFDNIENIKWLAEKNICNRCTFSPHKRELLKLIQNIFVSLDFNQNHGNMTFKFGSFHNMLTYII